MKVFKNHAVREKILRTYDTLLTLWDTPIREIDIPGPYGSTHVVLCGDEQAPPLVLFHGVGDNSALMWLYNGKELGKHFRVYAVDTIGGPGKSRPDERYNPDFDDIRWIDALLDALPLTACAAAGVSNGAYLVQYYAAARPERFQKIVCMAGSLPTASWNPMKDMMKIFLPEALFPTKANTVRLLQKLSGKNSAVFTENPVLLEHYGYLLRGFRNMAMRHHKLPSLQTAQIELLRQKALYLIGEEDPFVKLGASDMLTKHRMNVRFYPETGHGINHEMADAVHAAMLEYLC